MLYFFKYLFFNNIILSFNTFMINHNSKIFLAGHNGLVGSAILRLLKKKGYRKVITIDKSKLDLTNQKKVFNFLKKNKPKFIFIAAAKVGGIQLNSQFKADMLYEHIYPNQFDLFSFQARNKRFNFLGSSCVYPRIANNQLKRNIY